MKKDGCKKGEEKRLARVWRDKSADLGQPRDYQLSVGGEMRSEWLDLQTQVRKFQKKIRSVKVKI